MLQTIKKWLCNHLDCVDKISPPEGLVNIDFSEVYTKLQSEFPDANILLSDNRFKTTTKAEIMRFLKGDNTDSYDYISEYFDCDDFSFSLMGKVSNQDWGCLAFGIMWTSTGSGNHAVNCFIDSAGEVWIIEPQNDKMFKLPNGWKPYLVMM